MRYESFGGEVLAVKGGKVEAYDVLKTLYERDGELTTKAVVKEAKRLEKRYGPSSPLHGSFTWDVNEAAEKLWEIEARSLISSFQIEIVNKETTVRAFISTESGDSRSYKHSSDLAAHPDLVEAHKARLFKQAQQLGERMKRFDEFVEIVAAIERVTV